MDNLVELLRDAAKDLTVLLPAATVGSISLPCFDFEMLKIKPSNFALE